MKAEYSLKKKRKYTNKLGFDTQIQCYEIEIL